MFFQKLFCLTIGDSGFLRIIMISLFARKGMINAHMLNTSHHWIALERCHHFLLRRFWKELIQLGHMTEKRLMKIRA